MSSTTPSKPKCSSQGGFVLWHGLTVPGMFRLFAQRPAIDSSRWMQLGLLPLAATYNSLMHGVETLVYGRTISRTRLEHPPLFILGFWRSGTTLLHNLITKDPQFTYPTTYQCLFPWHFLTTEKVVTRLTASLVPESRPMDNVPASWDAPQEDEWALCLMSLVSPYIVLALQRKMETYEQSFDLQNLPAEDLKRWKEALDLFVRKLTVRENKPVVLKSPSHTYRIRTLLEMYPGARFLYIYRNPYSVFRSTVHLRETMVRENGLGRPRPLDHRSEVIKAFNHAFECYEQDRHLIPNGRLHEVRFEDLERDPLGELEKCYEGLRLPGFNVVRSIIEPEVPQLRRYKKNRFDHDPYWMRKVYDECREAFDRFGYGSPLDEQEQAADVVAA